MTNYSKNRVLALYKILMKYSDEKHTLSMNEVLARMESAGHSCRVLHRIPHSAVKTLRNTSRKYL